MKPIFNFLRVYIHCLVKVSTLKAGHNLQRWEYTNGKVEYQCQCEYK